METANHSASATAEVNTAETTAKLDIVPSPLIAADLPAEDASAPHLSAAPAALPEQPAPADPHKPAVDFEPVPSVAGLQAVPVGGLGGLWRRVEPARGEQSGPATADNGAATESEDAAQSGAKPQVSRFALLAASMALAAGLGAAVGAAGFAGVASLTGSANRQAAPSAVASADLVGEAKAVKEALAQMRSSVRALSDQVAKLRGGLDATNAATSGHIAKLEERIGKLHASVERSEKSRPVAAATAPKPATTAAVRPPEITGSIPSPAPRPAAAKPSLAQGWTLRRVYDGVALIEGRYGAIEVEPGDNIRGLGRVQEIQRQGGRWVVVTSGGLIVER